MRIIIIVVVVVKAEPRSVPIIQESSQGVPYLLAPDVSASHRIESHNLSGCSVWVHSRKVFMPIIFSVCHLIPYIEHCSSFRIVRLLISSRKV
jgi:hypothetical protein